MVRILYKPEFFFRPSFRNYKSFVYKCDDLLSYNSSLCSSRMWFSYIHNFIIILSRVNNEPIQLPAPSWLVGVIGRALHRCRRGQGFESVQAWIFFRLSFRSCKSCVYNCDDLLLIIILFVGDSKILRRHCLQLLLGVKMAETQNNAYAKFMGDKQRALWDVMAFSGVVN